MINVKDRKQLTFDATFEWYGILTAKQVRKLEQSWAGTFRKYFLPNLPVDLISSEYSEDFGRPTNELYTVIGACILQQIFDLTDEEAQDMISFNKQWHYALDNHNLEDHQISLRSLWTMRQLLIKKDAVQVLFGNINQDIISAFNVDTSHQRLDSTIIKSNMARIGRVRILSRCIHKFLINLKRQHIRLYTRLQDQNPHLIENYNSEQDLKYFGQVKPSESQQRLKEIASHMYFLIEYFAADEGVCNMYSYGLLTRVFSEHCEVREGQVQVRPNKDVPSGSIQNPSDTDAAYNGHKKSSGYMGQVMETYTPKDQKDDSHDGDPPELNLITHARVTPGNEGDASAVKPAISDLQENEITANQILADAQYGSDDNVVHAQASDVDLISPVKGTNKEHDFTGFTLDPETYYVISCPAGKAPDQIKTKKKTGMILNYWNKSTCENCPLFDQCRASKLKKFNVLKYTPKDYRLWLRRQFQETEEFKEIYRYRSGVEGAISQIVNTTGARRSRYRGFANIGYSFIVKVIGVNLFRTTKYIRLLEKELQKMLMNTASEMKNRLCDVFSWFWENVISVHVSQPRFTLFCAI